MDAGKFERRLRAERDEIVPALAAIAERISVPQSEGGGELTLTDQHPADAATETTQRELDLTHQQRLRSKLERIDAALERIKRGRYGTCDACGQPIAEERLEIIPETRYCVKDAAKEQREQG